MAKVDTHTNPMLDDEDDEFEYPVNGVDVAVPELPKTVDRPASVSEYPDVDDTALPDLTQEHLDTGWSQPLHTENGAFSEPVGDSLEDLVASLEAADDEETSEDLSLQDKPEWAEDDKSLSVLEHDFDDFEEMHEKRLDIDKVIGAAIEADASDIRVYPYENVMFDLLGETYRRPEFGVIDPDTIKNLQRDIISNVLEDDFVQEYELDTSYVVETGRHKGRRLRLNLGRTGGEPFMTFRVITNKMPRPNELGIPQMVQNWFKLPTGLILVNGPTGSGKSTTLSSLMQEIQFNERKAVITLEKPVEYFYGVKPGQKAVIVQREIGRDSRTFEKGIISAMRQAPKVILVGEVRFRGEIDQLLVAAETGHLAISTLHTKSCAGTINRISTMYEGDERLRVLSTLAENLRGLITQALVKSPDGKKRVAIFETLQIDAELRRNIMAGDSEAVRTYMQDRGITMEHELVKAVKAGRVDHEAARGKAPDPLYFDEIMEA